MENSELTWMPQDNLDDQYVRSFTIYCDTQPEATEAIHKFKKPPKVKRG